MSSRTSVGALPTQPTIWPVSSATKSIRLSSGRSEQHRGARAFHSAPVAEQTTGIAHEPDKLATYEKLTAAINGAKDRGDIETLRQIAGDPHGFIVRQGWAGLDFREEEQVARLRKLWESLELEILSVLEASNQLRESAEFELYELTAKQPEMLESVVAKQIAGLEREIGELASEAERLGREIEKLKGEAVPGIG